MVVDVGFFVGKFSLCGVLLFFLLKSSKGWWWGKSWPSKLALHDLRRLWTVDLEVSVHEGERLRRCLVEGKINVGELLL